MKKSIFIALFTLTFCAFTFGQNSTCPAISVNGPSSTVQSGEAMTFTANIDGNGFDLSKINYQWSVDKGTIIEGQGEPVVSVSTEGLIDAVINVTVEIKGLNNDCVKSSTGKGIVGGGCPVTFDEFGKLSRNDEKFRLSALVSELKDDLETNAFIILYHPSKNKRLRENRILQLKNFLTRENKIPAERIIIFSADDESEERTKIYIVPKGVELPTP